MKNLYEEIMVWRRRDQTSVVRYSCFRSLADNKFFVQSADFFSFPFAQKQFDNFNKQFVELFSESDPFERSQPFDSLEEAIEAHDQGFFNVKKE